jgi:hypothetical protein
VLALCGAQPVPTEGEGLSFFLVDGESGEHQPLAMSGGWGEGTPPIGRGRGGVIELRPIADAAVSGSDRLLLASTDGWLHLVSLAPLDEASASLPASGRGEMRVALPAGPTETIAAMDCDAAHCVIGGELGSLALVDLSRPDMCARPPSFTPVLLPRAAVELFLLPWAAEHTRARAGRPQAHSGCRAPGELLRERCGDGRPGGGGGGGAVQGRERVQLRYAEAVGRAPSGVLGAERRAHAAAGGGRAFPHFMRPF